MKKTTFLPGFKKPQIIRYLWVLLYVLLAVVILNTGKAQAANYTFSQSAWTGGSDATSTAAHPTNETGWNKYTSSTNTATGTNLSLALNPATTVSARTDITSQWAGNAKNSVIAIASSTGVRYIVYESYEYNGHAQNIALRSSADNFASRIDVTTVTDVSISIPSQTPSMAIDSNGVIHIAYYSNEYNSTYYNIAYRNSNNWATRTDVTASTSVSSFVPSIAISSTGVKYIAYRSGEYNGVHNIALRNSTNWAMRTDVTLIGLVKVCIMC